MSEDWIAALVPGDEVAIEEAGFTRSYRIDVVKTITETGQIVTVHTYGSNRTFETRFNADGHEKKRITRSSPHRDNLVELVPKLRDYIEFRQLFARLSSAKWGELTLDQLKRIDAILKEATP
jgi:hypothetical protein